MIKIKNFFKQWLIPPAILRLFIQLIYPASRSKLSTEDYRLIKKSEILIKRHNNTRCFIMGAGSSIKEQDISKMEGEVIISVSNTFVHPDFLKIRPRYHVLPPLMKSHGRFYNKEKLLVWLREMEAATGQAEMFLHIGDKKMIEENELFIGRIIHWVEYADFWNGDFDTTIDFAKLPPIWSVSELALTVALYMNFSKVYLVGFDHDWFNGALVYFYDHIKEHKLRPDINNLSYVDSEFQMRRHAEIFKKYKYLNQMKKNIYNANANVKTYVDVFPKVEFESLFK